MQQKRVIIFLANPNLGTYFGGILFAACNRVVAGPPPTPAAIGSLTVFFVWERSSRPRLLVVR